MLQGFLPILKPIGTRSSDCVERIKRILGNGTKVGHGGTLDSTACGVLVLLLGGATRLSAFVMQMPKIYRAVIKLGAETTTCDHTGEVTHLGDAGGVSESDIDRVIPSFMGWRMQTPPEISAVHVKGRRAHEIFRSGGEPDIMPRPVFIESMERTGSISDDGEAGLLIRCGKGTYVRAIARDIGRRLGCRAHIRSLSREAVGPFSCDLALDPGVDFAAGRGDIISSVKPVGFLGNFLPRYSVGEDDGQALSSGLEIPLTRAVRETPGSYCPDETILAIGSLCATVGTLRRAGGVVLIKPCVNIANAGSLARPSF